MSALLAYGRWVVGGSWARGRPGGSFLTWGRLAVSWAVSTLLVALVFALLAAGGFLGAVAVALLWPLTQVAVFVGLVYAARSPRRTP